MPNDNISHLPPDVQASIKAARKKAEKAEAKMAPASSDTGISRRLSGPVNSRIMCGTSSPTKPMMPETDTQTAATREAVINNVTVTLLVSTPSEDAARFPSDIRFKSRA